MWTFGGLLLLFCTIAGVWFFVHLANEHDDDDADCSNYAVSPTMFQTGQPEGSDGGWWSWGRDLFSSRFARFSRLHENCLGPDDIEPAFAINGRFQTDSNIGVTTTPTVDADTNIVYFSDWGVADPVTGEITGAKMYAVSALTGTLIWEHLISDWSAETNPLTVQGLEYEIAKAEASTTGLDPGVVNLNALVRVSPTITINAKGEKILVFGDQGTSANAALTATCLPRVNVTAATTCGPRVYGVDPATGDLLWRTLAVPISSSEATAFVTGIFTGSPTIFDNKAYFGLSSSVSGDVADIDSPFRDPGDADLFMGGFIGRMLAFDVTSGTQQMEYSVMQPTGAANVRDFNYTGAAVWGSAPPIDAAGGKIFFGTGNLYSQADYINTCLSELGPTEGELRRNCLENGIYNDAVFSLSTTLSPSDSFPLGLGPDWAEWINTPYGVDAWNVACIFQTNSSGTFPPGPPCPEVPGPDYDMGTGFLLIETECGRPLIVALQKSGILWAFDGYTGQTVWRTYVGPGSTLVNSWGMAFDGKRIYMSIANTAGTSWVARGRGIDGDVFCDGQWAAVDPETGEVLWTTPAPCSRTPAECFAANGAIAPDPFLVGVIPTDELIYADRGTPDYTKTEVHVDSAVECGTGDPRDAFAYARGHGALTVAGDVVLAGSSDGYMYVIDANDGQFDARLPRCPTGGVYGGATVARLGDEDADEYIYWGCGYRAQFGVLADSVVQGWTLKH